jgi:RNA polymerase sigma-70 factor (ECF subfamily)
MTSTTAGINIACRQPASRDEEAGWVRAACAGDADAVLALLARYRPPLVRLLWGVTGDGALAEDLAQEALILAFQSLAQLRDPGAFYPWVRRLAMRHALRAVRRETARSVQEAAEAVAIHDPAREAETRVAVAAVLASLSPDLRATLVLREIEQLDYGEIAEVLEVPIGTVRSRLFKAREQFRKAWLEMEECE